MLAARNVTLQRTLGQDQTSPSRTISAFADGSLATMPGLYPRKRSDHHIGRLHGSKGLPMDRLDCAAMAGGGSWRHGLPAPRVAKGGSHPRPVVTTARS